MFRRYGNIVKEEALWNIPVVSLKSREDIEKVLKYPSKYPMRPPTEVTAHYRASRPDRYANLGLVNEQGEEWHRLRTSLTPELTSGRTMNKIFPELTSIAVDFNDLIHHSRNLSTGVVHNFEELACRLGLESSCALILGERLGFLDDIIGPTAQKLADAVKEQFCASRDTFYSLPIWKFVSTSSYRQFVASEDTIYDVISEMVDKAEKLEEDTYSSDGTRGVFLSILKAPGVDVRDKKAAIIDFIAAGIKTTVVLCHTWLASLDDSNFPNAKTFMPERWIAEDGTCSSVNCHPFLVVPFGVGRRTCPGKRFVELELQVVLAQIIQRFEVDFDGELELDFEFLLAPHAPSNFIMRDRLAV
ncbi:unnamed protein product [Nesidiocoris tenuis]|uniref:Cytochrome P450 n=1 Tax=Nesidiocoris tenuis TaxID=355587 RepID=A0A6H5HCV3_9HEMI|nr:unnamed protein product [Nesidiocoris tenuis]